MALFHYLTREEWHACYFAGMREAADGKPCGNVQAQVQLGIRVLRRAGYTFRSLAPAPEGGYAVIVPLVPIQEAIETHTLASVGLFDPLQSAKEALRFAAHALPSMDWGWLQQPIHFIETHRKTIHSLHQAFDEYHLWLVLQDYDASQGREPTQTAQVTAPTRTQGV